VLFVTGHPLDGESQALLEKGHVHWLQKPFSVQFLFDKLAKRLPEVPHHSFPTRFSSGDAIQFVFHPCRKLIVNVLRKVVSQ
jgi:hypothetical protein